MISLIQNQLLTQACFMLAPCVDPASYGGDMMAQVKVKAFRKGSIDLPAIGGQNLVGRLQDAKDHTVRDPHQMTTSPRLDHLRIEEPWP
jgi:hypothetical protein